MLGVRLKPEEEARLERHARDVGRPKSAIARDWILERLERDTTDAMMAASATSIALDDAARVDDADRLDRWLETLDAEDGGYDWGPEGPPTPL